MATGDILAEARAHMEAGRLDAAMTAARRVLDLEPDNLDAMLVTAGVLRRGGSHDVALNMYETILAHFPDTAQGHAGLGACFGLARRYTRAVPALGWAIELDPDYFEAWSFLGEALVEQGRTDDAIDCFERSLAIQPYRRFSPITVSRFRNTCSTSPSMRVSIPRGYSLSTGNGVNTSLPRWESRNRLPAAATQQGCA